MLDLELFLLTPHYYDGTYGDPREPGYFTGSWDQFDQLRSQPVFNAMYGGAVVCDRSNWHIYKPMPLDLFQLFPIAPNTQYSEGI
jgi:hypothetical protein